MFRTLFDWIAAYVADLHRHGYAEWSPLPYAYGRFSNGFPTPELWRGVLHEILALDAFLIWLLSYGKHIPPH